MIFFKDIILNVFFFVSSALTTSHTLNCSYSPEAEEVGGVCTETILKMQLTPTSTDTDDMASHCDSAGDDAGGPSVEMQVA